MRTRRAVLAAVLLAAAAIAVALIFGGKETNQAKASPARPGLPTVEIVSPRNGARQNARAVVVKVDVENFQLAPAKFGEQPELGEGNIRFSLNRVPDCVDPVKLLHAINSPLGKARLKGRNFDYAEFAGPNGVLAERLGTGGDYSPATRPEIFYHRLPPGFYRLVATLAQNNRVALQYHDVTTFQILPRPGAKVRPCPPGKVSSAEAAAGQR